MTDILALSLASWSPRPTAGEQQQALDALEGGAVLFLPQLRFALDDDEARVLSPALAGQSKNISFDPASGQLRGASADEADLQRLKRVMARFAASTRSLLEQLLPHYATALQQARTSFRPQEIAGRPTSWRKDDTRLHVDSFPSSPTQGRRLLRVFSNINPHGADRHWRLGEPFEAAARRFAPTLRPPLPGSAALLQALGITKSRRSAYDHYMLQLHDRMKADAAYQTEVAQRPHAFPAGSSWMVYTDLVSHAAMRGQYALEQTYQLPVSAMYQPSKAPLRQLERVLGRELA